MGKQEETLRFSGSYRATVPAKEEGVAGKEKKRSFALGRKKVPPGEDNRKSAHLHAALRAAEPPGRRGMFPLREKE